jgi:hypothetical protein
MPVAGTGGEIAGVKGESDAADAGGRQLQFTAFLVGREIPEDDTAAVARFPELSRVQLLTGCDSFVLKEKQFQPGKTFSRISCWLVLGSWNLVLEIWFFVSVESIRANQRYLSPVPEAISARSAARRQEYPLP